jgi:hypothetical protein
LAFKSLIDFVKKLQITLADKNDKAIQEFKDLINQLSDKLENLNEQKLGEAQGKIDQALADQSKSLNFMRDWVRNIKNGKDGTSPDPQEVAQLSAEIALKTLLPKLLDKEAINQEISKAGDLIADTVSGLLEIKDIKNLQEILDELRQLRTRNLGGGGGFSAIAMQQHFIYWTQMTGTVDGANKDFTLGNAPNPIESLEVMVDNSPLFSTGDWTYDSATKTVSFTFAPPLKSIPRYKCLV